MHILGSLNLINIPKSRGVAQSQMLWDLKDKAKLFDVLVTAHTCIVSSSSLQKLAGQVWESSDGCTCW